MTRYKIPTKITRVEHKSITVRSWKTADGKVDATTQKIGWWVSWEGSLESYFLGPDRPDLYEGQDVAIIIDGAQPR
jgi:hypothetical protein